MARSRLRADSVLTSSRVGLQPDRRMHRFRKFSWRVYMVQLWARWLTKRCTAAGLAKKKVSTPGMRPSSAMASASMRMATGRLWIMIISTW